MIIGGDWFEHYDVWLDLRVNKSKRLMWPEQRCLGDQIQVVLKHILKRPSLNPDHQEHTEQRE